MRERCVNDTGTIGSYTPDQFQGFENQALWIAEQVMPKPMQRSYLLRLWNDHAGTPVRATLITVECPDKPWHFASIDELFAFVSAQANPRTPAVDQPEWDIDHCTPDGPY